LKLALVYNADRGALKALFDIGHKIISPKTYSCHLCQLTHGAFIEKKLWKEFKQETSIELKFYHRDDFLSHYPNFINLKLPSIFEDLGPEPLRLVLGDDQLKSIEKIEDLIQVLKDLQ
jgi:hypothetical protein